MTAKEVFELGYNGTPKIFMGDIFPHLSKLNSGAWEDVLNTSRSGYYQWLSGLMLELKPKQVVELGGAMGVADLMILATLPSDSKLYSITLAEHGLEFSYIDKEYPNFISVVGDDLDLTNWPKDLKLEDTDLWFIDSEHSKEQLQKELTLYTPFFKKGAIVLFDDIHINEGMSEVWNSLKGDKFEIREPLHYSGFGVWII